MKNLFLALCVIITQQAFAEDTCSRVATINHQEILIDANSQQKGENLRYYLERDPVALSFLDKYKSEGDVKWYNALLGTTGTAMIVAGIINDDDRSQRNFFLISGVSTLLINYFITRTADTANEKNLIRAIEEYNKRNLPRIEFRPVSYKDKISTQVMVSGVWNF